MADGRRGARKTRTVVNTDIERGHRRWANNLSTCANSIGHLNG